MISRLHVSLLARYRLTTIHCQVVIWDDRQCLHSTSPLAEKEERYGSGGVLGRRLMNNVSSSVVAAYRWGTSKASEEHDDDDRAPMRDPSANACGSHDTTIGTRARL
eukprot:COSAG02_NODE_12118_length_1593_cov_1.088353_1_plen_107_part_00